MEAEWDRRGRSEAQRVDEMKRMAHDLVASSVGFHIIDRKMPGPDEAVIDLSFDGEGRNRTFVLRRIGGEWRFHDIIFAGMDEPNGNQPTKR